MDFHEIWYWDVLVESVGHQRRTLFMRTDKSFRVRKWFVRNPQLSNSILGITYRGIVRGESATKEFCMGNPQSRNSASGIPSLGIPTRVITSKPCTYMGESPVMPSPSQILCSTHRFIIDRENYGVTGDIYRSKKSGSSTRYRIIKYKVFLTCYAVLNYAVPQAQVICVEWNGKPFRTVCR
jgi:hypothetical protein